MSTRLTLSLLSAALSLAWASPASAAGTWQTTLEGIDLDPEQPGYEAYYDTTLHLTWLTDVGAVKNSPFAWLNDGTATPLAQWFDAKQWAAQLSTNGVTGWRLPTKNEFQSMYFTTLGHSSALLAETGPFLNLGTYRPGGNWVGAYMWTSTVLGGSGDHTLIQTFGVDGYGWNTAYPGNPMMAWAVHDGRVEPPAHVTTRADWAVLPFAFTCKNNQTGQQVTRRAYQRKTIDCNKAGLLSQPGDSLTLTITGTRK